MNCDVEFNWHINEFCNFKCTYCYDKYSKNKNFRGDVNIDKIVNAFKGTGKKCYIYMSGGEPFFYPNFIELCQRLTKDHIIGVNTNLTHKSIYQFAEVINPDKVRSINCSLHILEREKLKLVDDFIEKYYFIKEKGFYTFVTYLVHPYMVHRLGKDYSYFKSQGIILRPKVFKGNGAKFKILESAILRKIRPFFGSNYPEAYTDEQRNIITYYLELSTKEGNFKIDHSEDLNKGRMCDVSLDKFYIKRYPSFKGKNCWAGSKFIRMTSQGDVFRCYDDNQYHGNLFNGKIKLFEVPQKCTAERCGCPYMGFIYSEKGLPT